MVKFPERYTEANNQHKQYVEGTAEKAVGNVIKLIKEWIKVYRLGEIVSNPVKINLSELNELVIERDIKQDKVDAVANTKKEVSKIEEYIWKEVFNEAGEINDRTKNYLWITFRADGMVITVGKTNMKTGDLLRYEDLYSSGTGDTRVILQQLLSDDDKKVLDDLSIRKHRYTQSALVMGIKVNLNDKFSNKTTEDKGDDKELLDKLLTKLFTSFESSDKTATQKKNLLDTFAQDLEYHLGEYLIGEGINILNRYSHCPKEKHITEQ